MNNKKLYFISRFKSIVLYLFFFFIVLFIISKIIGPPKHYKTPILAMIFGGFILEWWQYRDWKKNAHK
ncbi:hypothetical protein AEA09_03445 [Lysinibacillus contaminans]|uniref:Uncharacterized protein n=1 Tax=Lysinibacillus contaminans TaxID=1293441 RepID=A0ABR5JYX9_9BACI|nr:hypothetical protein AEA09_03445 [Lysinibacillus contaminans]